MWQSLLNTKDKPVRNPHHTIHAALAMALTLFCIAAAVMPAQKAFAHFEHFSHYNSLSQSVGKYLVYEALDPEYTPPNQPVAIQFSVQDPNGQDTHNIYTMVEVYNIDGDRVKAFPWTKQDIGDFQLFYNFPSIGSYQIVLSVADVQPPNANSIDPPRSLLSSSLGCSCDRFVFNVNISRDFGTVFNSSIIIAVVVPLGLIGASIGLAYKRRRKAGQFKTYPGDMLRYLITITAIAGGMIHFAVYSEHASLRIEYSIFLIVAGGMQVTYGVLYTMLTLVGAVSSGQTYPYKHYRKTVSVNLFGLIGSAILIGLYTYSVIFPPPLSPSNQPEHVDIEGIMAKSVEVFVVIGIVYLMRVEKKRYEALVKEHA